MKTRLQMIQQYANSYLLNSRILLVDYKYMIYIKDAMVQDPYLNI